MPQDPLTPAVIIGASGGIGAALAVALRDEDIPVRAFARSFTGADQLDLTDEASIAAAAVSLTASPQLVIVATGTSARPKRRWRNSIPPPLPTSSPSTRSAPR